MKWQDTREVFDLIRNISDPEHPNSLEELRVLRLEHIEVCSACVLSDLPLRVGLVAVSTPYFLLVHPAFTHNRGDTQLWHDMIFQHAHDSADTYFCSVLAYQRSHFCTTRSRVNSTVCAH